jgi:hypothetical protein
MIIYAGQPNNFFPRLVKDLQQEMFAKNKQVTEFNIKFYKKNTFLTAYSFRTKKFYSLQEMLENPVSYNGDKIHLANYILNSCADLVTGIINLDRVEKNNTDFLFTFISNPVDRVYDMYYFLKAALINKTALRLDKDIVECFLPGFSAFTLHDFIDSFLEKKGVFRSTTDIQICSNIFLQPKHLYRADFIGIKEKLKTSIVRLNNKLNINIDPEQYDKFITDDKCHYTYKRNDILQLLKDDLAAYNSIFSQS